MRDRKLNLSLAIMAVMIIALISCATTPLGKAVESADIQKQLVQASAVEFAKLHLQGKVSDDIYKQGKDAYEKWANGEKALAKSLADWKRIGDTASADKLTEALKLSGELFKTWVNAVGPWVDFAALQKKITGGN